MIVKYKGMVLHDYEYDLCEEVADMEKPLYCPFKKGKYFEGSYNYSLTEK